jgi:hypothetical protein
MELEYALLANNAEAGAGGRIHLFGAHIDTIKSHQYPATTGFSFVARLRVRPDEYGQRHRFRIELGLPDGARRPLMSEDQEFETVASAIRPELGSSMAMIVQAPHVELNAPGDYTVHLLVDDCDIGSVPFYARESNSEG